MQNIKTVTKMRAHLAAWREAGDSIAFVPTMGNLHAGHMSLVELASQHAEHVVVSIFVNPTQFGPGEDFARYPRTPESDVRRLKRAGVDALFIPSDAEMYPNGIDAATQVNVPAVSEILEGEHRPGHFAGVASVVCRLLNICQPDVAVFGQKDYQQLVVLRQMVRDLHMPVKVLAGPTKRAENGLALSSRNQYLNARQKDQAGAIYGALSAVGSAIEKGRSDWAELEAEGWRQLESAGLHPEYFAVRRAVNLSKVETVHQNLVVLAAVRLGDVRLIDNLLVARPA